MGKVLIILKDYKPYLDRLYFNFTKDTCDKIKNDYCSLDKYKNDLNRYYYDPIFCRKEYPKCVSMYFAMVNNNIYADLPRLYKYKCGHYMCEDGQHRICIAAKTGLSLECEYNEEIVDDKCEKCKGWSNISLSSLLLK